MGEMEKGWKRRAGLGFEACGYAAFLQNAGFFAGGIPRVCTLGWYAMPRQGMGFETRVENTGRH